MDKCGWRALSENSQAQSHLYRNLKISNTQKQRVEWLLPGAAEEEHWEDSNQGHKIPAGQDIQLYCIT
jgi:hypothetical protein